MSDATVRLVKIDRSNLRAVLELDVAPDQQHFVAPNAVSIAEAHFSQEKAWMRAVYAGEQPVGFAMLYLDRSKEFYYLWRLMIDARFQRSGYGAAAVKLLIEFVSDLPGAKQLKLSYVPGIGNPGRFYEKLGFIETGDIHDGEIVMALSLPSKPPAATLSSTQSVAYFLLSAFKDGVPDAAISAVRSFVEDKCNPGCEIEIGANMTHDGRTYDLIVAVRASNVPSFVGTLDVDPVLAGLTAILKQSGASTSIVSYNVLYNNTSIEEN